MVNKLKLWFICGVLAVTVPNPDVVPGGPAKAAVKIETVDWSKAKLLTVTAVEYRFIPSHLVIQQGVPYRLLVENKGAQIHDLTAPDFFAAVEVRNADVLARSGTQLSVWPSKRKEVYFIAGQSGFYGLVCADHDWAGMAMNIEVK